jgi:DNA-binding protein HU-beta
MTKAELIEKIARSRELPSDVTKKCIGQILDLAFEELGAYFVRARVTRAQCPRFTFPAFGTFTKKKRSARKGINPRTLEPMTIDAAYTIDFRPGTELRQNLNLRAAPASAGKGKRRGASPADLSDDSERLTLVPAAPEFAGDDAEDDGVPIERRRFTHRDDLDEDDADELDCDDVDEAAELPDEPVTVTEPVEPGKYELPAAPMQRARVRGAASTRTGS